MHGRLSARPKGVAFDVPAFDVHGHRFARFHPVCQAHQKPHWILIFNVVRVLDLRREFRWGGCWPGAARSVQFFISSVRESVGQSNAERFARLL